MLIETCKAITKSKGSRLIGPHTHTNTHTHTSTQHARGGTHHLQNITDNRVEINDVILINA